MPDRASAVTLMDVAREAGVSLATASRVVNGSKDRRVRADLREQVLAAAAALRYSVNAQAQATARGVTDVVGLVVHDIADPYFSSIAAGVMRSADEHGLIVSMSSTGRRPERELDYVATLRSQRARALILAGSRVDDPALHERLAAEVAAFEAAGGRVAAISQKRLPVDTVLVENRAGARALAEDLVGEGHHRFAVLAGPRALFTARDRVAGFCDGLVRAGSRPPEHVLHGAFTRDGGYTATAELLARATGPMCLFAVNDVMAVGAMAALRDRGVALPEQMGVAGFDDIHTLRDITPGLTTVRLPLEEMGATALELVLSERGERPRLRRVRGEVIRRESTGRPANRPTTSSG